MSTKGHETAGHEARVEALPECRKHRPWVGVVVSILIPGAAQFLSGRRRTGVLWLGGLLALGLLGDLCMASPWVPGVIPGTVLLGIGWVVWLVMLVKSWLPIPRMRVGGWVLLVAAAGVVNSLAVVLSSHISQPFYMPASSMVPTILGEHLGENGITNRGDKVMVDCTAYWFADPAVGDLVVFRTKEIQALPPDQVWIKRVIGVPGDELSIRDSCLLNHGEKVAVPAAVANLRFIERTWPSPLLSEKSEPFMVPPDTLFVVGDNTENSNDSRHFGPIPAGNVVGRVTKIYWPLGRTGDVE